ncbi:hypothetical protein C8R45DRAFT_990980 [Mycena sanguinolenta]|nr:hypothetical protein C8R45DRAFT_990980 [Mycena sanguinolenta]
MARIVPPPFLSPPALAFLPFLGYYWHSSSHCVRRRSHFCVVSSSSPFRSQPAFMPFLSFRVARCPHFCRCARRRGTFLI